MFYCTDHLKARSQKSEAMHNLLCGGCFFNKKYFNMKKEREGLAVEILNIGLLGIVNHYQQVVFAVLRIAFGESKFVERCISNRFHCLCLGIGRKAKAAPTLLFIVHFVHSMSMSWAALLCGSNAEGVSRTFRNVFCHFPSFYMNTTTTSNRWSVYNRFNSFHSA